MATNRKRAPASRSITNRTHQEQSTQTPSNKMSRSGASPIVRGIHRLLTRSSTHKDDIVRNPFVVQAATACGGVEKERPEAAVGWPPCHPAESISMAVQDSKLHHGLMPHVSGGALDRRRRRGAQFDRIKVIPTARVLANRVSGLRGVSSQHELKRPFCLAMKPRFQCIDRC
jgi:hypothetical protein